MAQFTLRTDTGKKINFDDADEINRGGEGRILTIKTDASRLAKIYLPGKPVLSLEKFNSLCKIKKTEFIMPETLLFDGKHPAGYIMEYLEKKYLPFSSLFSKNFCKKNGIDFKFKSELARKLAESIRYLHEKKIIIGDLNPYNLFFKTDGSLKFIDTDSYQCPGHPHSGLVLEEVRDFQQNGKINKESDYFAYAVLLFYMFSFTHPFRGIHPDYKSLRERVIMNLPIFAGDPKLKVPRSYVPLQNKQVMQQFEDIFLKSQRYLISLSGEKIKAQPQRKTYRPVQTESSDLIIKELFNRSDLLSLNFGKRIGYFEFENSFEIFSAENRAYINRKALLLKTEADSIFLGTKRAYFRKAEDLFVLQPENDAQKLRNVRISKTARCFQVGTVLCVIARNTLFRYYLDEYANGSLRVTRTEIFGPAFSEIPEPVQRQGGVNRIFFQAGKELATIKIPYSPKAIRQDKLAGIIQYVEKDKTRNRLFRTEGLKAVFDTEELPFFTRPAYMPLSKNNGLIITPAEGKILMRRSEDFAPVSELNCDFISEQSELFYTQSGIIAREEDAVYLLNSKYS